MRNKELIYEYLFIILIIILNLSFTINFLSNHYDTIIDEKVAYYPVKYLFENGNLTLDNSANVYYNTCIFSSYLTASDFSRNSYFSIFSTNTLFYITFYMSFLDNFLKYSTIIFSLGSVLIFYYISRRLFSKKYICMLLTLVFSLSPIFLKYSSTFFNCIPTLFFFLFITFEILKDKDNRNYFLVGLFFFCLIMIRPQDLVLIFPILFFMFINKESKRSYIIFITFPFLFIAYFLSVNFVLYKSIFFLPPMYITNFPCLQYDTGSYSNSIMDIFHYFTYGGSKRFLLYFTNLIFFLNSSFIFPVLIPSCVLLIVYILKKDKFAIWLFSIFVVLFLLYGYKINYFGFGNKSFQTSLFRYMIYFYSLLPFIFGKYINKMTNRKFLIILIFSSVMLLIFTIPLVKEYYPGGIDNFNLNKDQTERFNLQFEKFYNKSDIFIVDYYTNKLASPNKTNIIQLDSILSDSKIPTDRVYLELYSVIDLALYENKSVYFIKQTGYNNSNILFNNLSGRYNMIHYLNDYSFDTYKLT